MQSLRTIMQMTLIICIHMMTLSWNLFHLVLMYMLGVSIISFV
jgi:hypothetical protein